jgi:hypothetical protein
MDVAALQAEVTRTREVIVVAEATCAMAVLAAEACVREAATAWDDTTLLMRTSVLWLQSFLPLR